MTQSSDVTEQQEVTINQELSPDVSYEPSYPLARPPIGASASSEKMQQLGKQVAGFFAELPDYVGKFLSEYQNSLTTLVLIVGGLITVKVTLAVLDAINDVPLLAPTFELVGIGYSAWFIYRYLLQASTRQELAQEFKNLKGQVVGKGDS